MNLISNTVKFIKRGRVSLTVGCHRDEMMFKIEDTSAGIPDDLQLRIFDDIFTGKAAFDREVGRTDLGLSIAKWFIHILSDKIAVARGLNVGVHSVWWCPPKPPFHQLNRFVRLRDPVYLHPCEYWLLRITRSTELPYARC